MALTLLLLLQEDIDALIDRLGDESYEVREAATRDILKVGPRAVLKLQEARSSDDPEVAARATWLLRAMTPTPKPSTIRVIRLRFIDAAETESALREPFKPLQMAPDIRTNSLMATGEDTDLLDRLEEVVAGMDAP